MVVTFLSLLQYNYQIQDIVHSLFSHTKYIIAINFNLIYLIFL